MMDGSSLPSPGSESPMDLDWIRDQLLAEYAQGHNWPWIVGYSGGKDSTMVVHLVFEVLLSLSPSRRSRVVHIVANDTLVESPVIVEHIKESLKNIQRAADALNIPVVTKVTRPEPNQSFWVNLIGRGYPSPNRSFRWCTDRMKIRPTTNYIKSLANVKEKVILLLGVRRSESSARAAMVAKYDNGARLHQHADLQSCLVFRPLLELSTDQVWGFLATNDPPWGGSHLRLINLYRNASGGSECPVATSKEDVATCGSSSARFGCWTCTVVEKDRSLEGFVESGYEEFAPLVEFRDWLVSIRGDENRRQARRKNGKVTFMKDGKLVLGPYTFETRHEIYTRLMALQKKTGKLLISEDERSHIHHIWDNEFGQRKKLQAACSKKVEEAR